MSVTYRYRIMGRFLHKEGLSLYGMFEPVTDERLVRQLFNDAQKDAERYGRWTDLRLERQALSDWESA